MALGAVLAAALNTAAAHPYGLFLDGLDVIRNPATGVGVPLGSIVVDEATFGGVSAMTFTIDDPLIACVLAEGMDVRYDHLAIGIPLFRGTVQSWGYRPAFGGQGREIAVTCVGAEARIDWSKSLAEVIYPAGMTLLTAIQAAAAASAGHGGLRAVASSSPGDSSQASPIPGDTSSQTLQYAVTIPAGTSLREAIRLLGVAATVIVDTSKFSFVANYSLASVDFWLGLRVVNAAATTFFASDWADFFVGLAPATLRIADLDFVTEAAVARGIYIKGANAAGSGYLGDGTGLPGPIAYLSDPTIDTAGKLAAAQTDYLMTRAQKRRGTFRVEAITSSSVNSVASQVRAGSMARIHDVAAGVAGERIPIAAIRKTFHDAGRETWEVDFGTRARGSDLLRTLTRSTLS